MLLILFHVSFCWCVLGIVTGIKITYTNESFTADGNPCITDCIDNQCMAEWDKYVRCNPGHTPGLTYYTTRERTPRKWCISRCGRFNDARNRKWCYVSDTDWDHCEDQRQVQYIKNEGLTVAKGPCMNSCRYYGENYRWCNYQWDAWDYCKPELHTHIIQATTVNGDYCDSVCGLDYETRPNWCVDIYRGWNNCAPPSRDFSSFRQMFQTFVLARNDRQCHSPKEQPRKESFLCESGMCDGVLESTYVSDFVELLEHSYKSLLTREVNEAGNPVHRYTVMPPALADDPMLPLLVRAKVTNKTLRFANSGLMESISNAAQENVRRMGIVKDKDEVKRLIGFNLGGPDVHYNFVPQTRLLNQEKNSQWYRNEKHIYDFVKNFDGWAEILILVVYKDLPRTTRPDGFVVNTALYNPDHTLFDECENKYYAN